MKAVVFAAASLLMLWTGENIGLGTYHHLLAASPDGAHFGASLALGAKSALAFWPGLTSLIILLAGYGGRRPASEAWKGAGDEGDGEVGGGLRRLGG